jgi:hypothetical protein
LRARRIQPICLEFREQDEQILVHGDLLMSYAIS